MNEVTETPQQTINRMVEYAESLEIKVSLLEDQIAEMKVAELKMKAHLYDLVMTTAK